MFPFLRTELGFSTDRLILPGLERHPGTSLGSSPEDISEVARTAHHYNDELPSGTLVLPIRAYTTDINDEPIPLEGPFRWVDALDGYHVAIVDKYRRVRPITTPPPDLTRVKIYACSETSPHVREMSNRDMDDHPVGYLANLAVYRDLTLFNRFVTFKKGTGPHSTPISPSRSYHY